MRILVIEDDARIAEPVAAALRSQHHVVDLAQSGEIGLALSDAEVHDIVLLDIMLPGVGGLEVCRSLRKRGSQAKVLMMTARDTVNDKIAALDGGADDYLVKPFELAELLARIRALSRRGLEARHEKLTHQKLELDPVSAQMHYNGRLLHLTRTEFAILETMLRHPTRVFSSEMLYDRVSAIDGTGSRGAIKSHMANLRKKLRLAGARREVLVTVHGFGYRLTDV